MKAFAKVVGKFLRPTSKDFQRAISDALHEIENEKFLLIYLSDVREWYLRANGKQGQEISCLVSELATALNLGHQSLPIAFWLKKYSDQNGNLSEVGVEIATNHLNTLLGFNNNVIPSLYFPLIKTINLEDQPILDDSTVKYITPEEWLEESVYSISDNKRKSHTLTRRDLIVSCRDQDGGGHFDLFFKMLGYSKSKYGELLAVREDGREILQRTTIL